MTVCPGVQTTMPDNRDRRRASRNPGQVRDHGDIRVADFRVGPTFDKPTRLSVRRPASEHVSQKRRTSRQPKARVSREWL
jgi:hypothetical protein